MSGGQHGGPGFEDCRRLARVHQCRRQQAAPRVGAPRCASGRSHGRSRVRGRSGRSGLGSRAGTSAS